MHRRLPHVMEETDDEDVKADRRRTREQRLRAIVTVDDQWRKQHGTQPGHD